MVSGSPLGLAEGWLSRQSAQRGVAEPCLAVAGQIKTAERKSRKDRPPTVAIDLDGTLAKMYDKFDPKQIEPPRPGARKAVQKFKDRGWRVIIHTVRGDKKLVEDWLTEHEIPWDFINENPDQPPGSSDKPVADLYIDDRGIDARKAWTTLADQAIQRIEKQGEVLAWQQVPQLVAYRYKEAASVQRAIKKVTKHLPVADPGYGHVYWNPDTKTAWAVLSDGDDQHVHQKWHNALKAIPGVRNVRTESEYGPHGDDDWIRIKSAAGALSWLNKPYQIAGLPVGGPSPMSNAIVSGLLGAGLGYGGGWLAEQLLPEEYVERGKLRKNLALLGGLGGAALHVPQAFANANINRHATGKPQWMRSVALGDKYQPPMAPHEPDWRNNFMGGHIKRNAWDMMRAVCRMLDDPPELLLRSSEGFVKEAFALGSGAFGSQGVPLKPVPVDAFNRAIWNDVHNGVNSSMSNPYGTRSPFGDNSGNFTPPVNAAAATGLVTGVQQMYGNAPLLHPKHFISGLANAGVDLATARVAGGVLGALGGLTPNAQKKIQDMGLWSGMIRGVTGSVLGLR